MENETRHSEATKETVSSLKERIATLADAHALEMRRLEIESYGAEVRLATQLKVTKAQKQTLQNQLEDLRRHHDNYVREAELAAKYRKQRKTSIERFFINAETGQPKRLLRGAMYHPDGRPRKMCRSLVLRSSGQPRRAFEQWMRSEQYRSLPSPHMIDLTKLS